MVRSGSSEIGSSCMVMVLVDGKEFDDGMDCVEDLEGLENL